MRHVILCEDLVGQRGGERAVREDGRGARRVGALDAAALAEGGGGGGGAAVSPSSRCSGRESERPIRRQTRFPPSHKQHTQPSFCQPSTLCTGRPFRCFMDGLLSSSSPRRLLSRGLVKRPVPYAPRRHLSTGARGGTSHPFVWVFWRTSPLRVGRELRPPPCPQRIPQPPCCLRARRATTRHASGRRTSPKRRMLSKSTAERTWPCRQSSQRKCAGAGLGAPHSTPSAAA